MASIETELIGKNLEEAGGCLCMGEISTGLIKFLSAKQNNIILSEDYTDSIEKSLDFLDRAEGYIKEVDKPTMSGFYLLNKAERRFAEQYFLRERGLLQELRPILTKIKKGLQVTNQEIETLLGFYDCQIDYVLNRHEELIPTY